MKTIELQVYSFNELSEKAKENAIENYLCSDHDFFYSNEYLLSLKKGLEAFNCSLLNNYKIDYSSSATSYVSFENNNENTEELNGQRLRTWLINNFYSVFYERKKQGKYEKRNENKWSYKRYSRIQFKETCCPFTGYCGDEDFLSIFRKYIENPENFRNYTFEDLIKEAIEDLLSAIQNDYEHQTSEEYLADFFEANKYEFTKEGKQF